MTEIPTTGTEGTLRLTVDMVGAAACKNVLGAASWRQLGLQQGAADAKRSDA
jgi:hypothetical protein